MDKKLILGTVSVAISALAYFVSSGVLGDWGSYMWIAPLPILLFSFYSSNIAAFTCAYLAYFLGTVAATYYLSTGLPIELENSYPISLYYLSNAFDALIFALIIVITRHVVLRLNHWTSIFIFPSLWTAYEYIVSLISSGATNNSIANSQIEWLSIIQIASITGIWGITFLLTLIPASIAISWRYRHTNMHTLMTLTIPAIIFIAVASWGFWQLKQEYYVPSMIVGLATIPESPQDLKSTDKNTVLNIVDHYINAVNELADEGASIILLPEKIVTALPAYLPTIVTKFSQAAKTKKVTLIVGLNEPIDKKNVALVIGPDGKTQFEYTKQHIVRFNSEADYTRGNSTCVFSANEEKLGVTICHDIDYQNLGRDYSRARIGTMFVPALDYVTDAWLHARVAIIRGIEGGFSVVRNAQWGYMTISDPQGQISEIRMSSFNTPTMLLSTVSPGDGNTFYAKTGDWLPWLSMIIASILLYRTAKIRKQV